VIAARRALLVAGAAFALGMGLGATGVRAQQPGTSEVQRVAREWLLLSDKAPAAATWKETGAKFQSAITADRWAEAFGAVRDPLGEVQQRAVDATQFQRSIPGAPDGEYAIVLFRTAFARKAGASETVTLEHEPDGKWRVVGYFVR
jgi:hypothetical protein